MKKVLFRQATHRIPGFEGDGVGIELGGLFGGEVFTVEELEIPGYYCQSISRDDVVRVSNGWQGFMPKHNDVMTVYYYPLRTYSGQVVWNDEENIEEFRPDSVTVRMMRGDDVVAYCDVSEPWEFSFENYPDYDNGVPIEYTFTHRSMSRISKDSWEYDVNVRGNSTYTVPMSTGTTFERNRTYESVEELPSNARKISDSAFYYPTYFWTEGTKMYWWSEAEHVYLPANCNLLFQRAGALSYLDLSEFDFTYVTNMGSMFSGSTGIQEIVFGENCDTSGVTAMGGMFSGCSKLTSVDVEHLNTANATSFGSMFRNCSSLVEIDLSSWDAGNVTSLNNMFSGCTSLQRANCAGLSTSKNTGLSYTFQGCKNLTELNVSGWDTSKVIWMDRLFNNCSSLEELNLSGWNGQSVQSIQSMFSGCSSLRILGMDGFAVGSKVTSYDSLFYGCSSLPEVSLTGWNSSRVTSMTNMFCKCSALVNVNLHDLDTGKVTSMARMFNECTSLAVIDLSGFNTTSLKDVSWMFLDDPALTEVDLSSWDTSALIHMTSMFENCTSLSKVYVGDLWDMSNINSYYSNDVVTNCISLVGEHGLAYADYQSMDYWCCWAEWPGHGYGYFWYKAAPTQSDDP